jgi:hypothetical protein
MSIIHPTAAIPKQSASGVPLLFSLSERKPKNSVEIAEQV